MTVALAPLTAQAGAIYQWKDETGQVQMSDAVPAKYKRTATRIDSRDFNLEPDQLKAAQTQAAALKKRANEAGTTSTRDPPAAARAASPSEPRSRRAVNKSDCSAWRRAYDESRNCFGGFQTNHGPLRQGAFEACGPEIENPEPQCGPERWQ